ncbi:MAG: SHOCT domain-containing protein [Bradyrhizobiaceae bacterium]|nr:SHOCT domain-containing protein [Bradyrhizobiaceae bacterium]
MKVLLDLDELRQAGEIDEAEYEKLKRLSKRSVGSLAFSILIGFGVVAVTVSLMALVPTPVTAIALGIALAALGLWAQHGLGDDWRLFAQICIVLGALLFAGGVVMEGKGSVASFLIVAAVLTAGGLVAQNSLLIAGAVLALASCIGVRTAYFHAAYLLGVQEPALTVVAFSVLALVAYQVSLRVAPAYERVALMAARVSVLLVNLGFWVGSLWGDRLMQLKQLGVVSKEVMIGRAPFGILWAVALIGVAIWAVRANRRWVVNVAAIFGAIHFYTQWFERFGADPITVFLAGLLALAIALGLWHFNKYYFAARS